MSMGGLGNLSHGVADNAREEKEDIQYCFTHAAIDDPDKDNSNLEDIDD